MFTKLIEYIKDMFKTLLEFTEVVSNFNNLDLEKELIEEDFELKH